MDNSLAILAIFKNESTVLAEWLSHYYSEGVSQFYLINNSSSDDWRSVVASLPFSADIFILDDPRPHCQYSAYNNFFFSGLCTSEWLLVCDLDEFVYARHPFLSITGFLATLDDNISVVKLPWKNFGSSGLVSQPASLREGFIRRAPSPFPLVGNTDKTWCKYIVRLSRCLSLGIHAPCVNGGTAILPDLSPASVDDWSSVDENSLKAMRLHLNHYRVQSFSHFQEVQSSRGDAFFPARVRPLSYFYDNDTNELYDDELSTKSRASQLRGISDLSNCLSPSRAILSFSLLTSRSLPFYGSPDSRGLSCYISLAYSGSQLFLARRGSRLRKKLAKYYRKRSSGSRQGLHFVSRGDAVASLSELPAKIRKRFLRRIFSSSLNRLLLACRNTFSVSSFETTFVYLGDFDRERASYSYFLLLYRAAILLPLTGSSRIVFLLPPDVDSSSSEFLCLSRLAGLFGSRIRFAPLQEGRVYRRVAFPSYVLFDQESGPASKDPPLELLVDGIRSSLSLCGESLISSSRPLSFSALDSGSPDSIYIYDSEELLSADLCLRGMHEAFLALRSRCSFGAMDLARVSSASIVNIFSSSKSFFGFSFPLMLLKLLARPGSSLCVVRVGGLASVFDGLSLHCGLRIFFCDNLVAPPSLQDLTSLLESMSAV